MAHGWHNCKCDLVNEKDIIDSLDQMIVNLELSESCFRSVFAVYIMTLNET